MLHLNTTAVFLGPNTFSDEPVVVVELTAAEALLQDSPRRIEKLSAASSRWFQFKAKSSDSTLITLAEFIAQWAHALLNHGSGEIVTARTLSDNPSNVKIVLGHYHPQPTLQALRLAMQVFADSDKLDTGNLEKICQNFRQSCQAFHPDFQAKILIDYAEKNQIPVRPNMIGTRSWQYGWGARAVTLFESSNMQDSAIGARWSSDKMLSKQLFARLGAPTAPSVIVTKEDELLQAASVIGFPCVTKPLDRSRSIGVTTNLKSQSDLINGFRVARQQSQSGIMVEKHFDGEVHRVMVMQGKFWRVVRRNRPSVTGDGRLSVLQLTENLAKQFRATKKASDFLGPAPIDAEFHQCLLEQGLNADHVPAVGDKVRIRNIPLLASGAHYENVTSQTHVDVQRISEALAQNFGISNCGLDYITDDIAQSCFGHGIFLEINLTPGLRVPLMAGIGLDEIGRAVLGEKPASIPLTLVVAPKEDFPDLIPAKPETPETGWITGQRCGIGNMEFSEPTANSFAAFDLIVRHKSVEKIWVLIDPSEIIRNGLFSNQISQTFVLANSNMDASWIDVLKKHSAKFEIVQAVSQLATMVGSCKK